MLCQDFADCQGKSSNVVIRHATRRAELGRGAGRSGLTSASGSAGEHRARLAKPPRRRAHGGFCRRPRASVSDTDAANAEVSASGEMRPATSATGTAASAASAATCVGRLAGGGLTVERALARDDDGCRSQRPAQIDQFGDLGRRPGRAGRPRRAGRSPRLRPRPHRASAGSAGQQLREPRQSGVGAHRARPRRDPSAARRSPPSRRRPSSGFVTSLSTSTPPAGGA